MRAQMLQTVRTSRVLVIVLLSILLAACGAEESEDEPTATSAPAGAQPTVSTDVDDAESTPATPESTSAPMNVDMSSVESEATPGLSTSAAEPGEQDVSDAASPVAGEERATPESGSLLSEATPVVGQEAAGASTPAVGAGTTPDEAIPGDADVGDGTTGAVVPGEGGAVGSGSPAATPVESSATPAVGATPAALLTVTGCEVADVPPFGSEITAHRLTTDINFRVGPGAECDLAVAEPIGAFMVVEVIGGPVVREDDGSEWVQIETLGVQGWVAYEFLEPVEN